MRKKGLVFIVLLSMLLVLFVGVQVPEVKAPTVEFSTSSIASIHTCPLDATTFVVAYADTSNEDISFQIYDTNGTQILVETDADIDATSVDYTSVGVSAFNSTTFVIGWFDRTDEVVEFAIYDISGSLLVGPIDADVDAGGWSMSVQVSCFNSTYFVIAWHDYADSDATFMIYNSAGANLTSQIDADIDIGGSFAVSVSAFNSTTFVIGWWDVSADYDTTFAIYDSTGANKTLPIDVDTGAGTSSYSVSVSTFNSTTFVIGWSDDLTEDATFAVYDSGGTLKTGPTDVDADIGGSKSVQVASLNSTAFVISWRDEVDYDLTFATYLSDGTVVSSATDIETHPTGSHNPFKYQFPCSQESATGTGIVDDYLIIAYANTTSQVVWKLFQPDGSEGFTPTIGEFSVSDSRADINGIFFVKARINDVDGRETFKNITLTLNHTIYLNFIFPDIATKTGDPNGYCTYGGFARVNINSTSYSIDFRVAFSIPFEWDIINAIVFDENDLNGTNSEADLFITDYVSINSFTADDNRIDLNATATFTTSGVYAWDSTTWAGTRTLNETATQTTVGRYGYNITAITDTNYGLTVWDMNTTADYVIFDKMTITYSTDLIGARVGDIVVFSVVGIHQYDDTSVTFSTLLTQRDEVFFCMWVSFSDIETEGATHLYTALEAVDTAYGITVFTSNFVVVTWWGGIPFWVPFLLRILSIVLPLGAVAYSFSRTKTIRDGLVTFVVCVMAIIAFLIMWYFALGLEAMVV